VLTAGYRKHAEECRRLAQQMVAPEDERALGTWLRLGKCSQGCTTETLCPRTEHYEHRDAQKSSGEARPAATTTEKMTEGKISVTAGSCDW
jgi:hypothetical protein